MINKDFLKGFLKTASPLLTEKTYDIDGSEHERKSQAILEASYDDDKEDSVLSKRQKRTKKAVSEPVNTEGNRVKFYPGERTS